MSRTVAKKKAVKKKATPKKKVAVLRVFTLSAIEKFLEKKGYRMEKDNEDCNFTYRLIKFDNRSVENVVFFNSTSLSFCCGVMEIGALEIRYTTLDKERHEILDLLMAYAFLDIRDQYNNDHKTRKVQHAKAVIFCSNGISSSAIFERTANKYLKNSYKMVSETINPNSENTIKMFVSTY